MPIALLPSDGLVNAEFLAGFATAEGCFTGDRKRRLRFAVALGATDRGMCEAFRDFLGVGRVSFTPRRRPHYDDESAFVVDSVYELADVVVPFMDEHLPPSYKRQQYEAWREELLDFVANQVRRRGRAPCTVDGCELPQRAHALCRHHMYAAGFG